MSTVGLISLQGRRDAEMALSRSDTSQKDLSVLIELHNGDPVILKKIVSHPNVGLGQLLRITDITKPPSSELLRRSVGAFDEELAEQASELEGVYLLAEEAYTKKVSEVFSDAT